jgi:hypothetical protein
MPPITPYTGSLAGREPLAAMRDAIARYEAITAGWTAADFERSYAEGKWSARLILVHLAQTEIALGFRARMTLVTPNYTSVNFAQDEWLTGELATDAATARQAFLALSRLNQQFFATLSREQLDTTLTHPEYGPLTVDWILHQMAGHYWHHLGQFEQIVAGTRDSRPPRGSR